jgi:hypothetical protein
MHLSIEQNMAKKSMSDSDYKLLKVFVDRHFDWYTPKYPTTPNLLPSQFLENIEKSSLSNAKKGLTMALNDIAEMCVDWPPEQVEAADVKFKASGTFTLSEVIHRYSKTYQRILKRGKIVSEEEYYVVKGIVDGGHCDPAEIEQLDNVLTRYEESIVRPAR